MPSNVKPITHTGITADLVKKARRHARPSTGGGGGAFDEWFPVVWSGTYDPPGGVSGTTIPYVEYQKTDTKNNDDARVDAYMQWNAGISHLTLEQGIYLVSMSVEFRGAATGDFYSALMSASPFSFNPRISCVADDTGRGYAAFSWHGWTSGGDLAFLDASSASGAFVRESELVVTALWVDPTTRASLG